MKKTLRYAAYHFSEESGNNSQFIFDIRPFLKAYSEYGSLMLKSSFEKSGEKIYLLPAEEEVMQRNQHFIPRLYYFVKTKDQEIIRKIDKEELTVSDIKEKLQEDESIAFAAYVYFTEKLICFVPTIYGPTLNELGEYLNELFSKLQIQLKMHITIMADQTTVHEAQSLKFIGRSTIEIDSKNKMFQGVIDAIKNFKSGGQLNLDTSTLGSIEVVFKPARRGGNIKPVISPLLLEDNLDGVKKFNLRAKEELEERLSDYYIMSKGALSDLIDLKDKGDGNIASSISEALHENEQLATRLSEWEHEGKKSYSDSCILSLFCAATAWDSNSTLL